MTAAAAAAAAAAEAEAKAESATVSLRLSLLGSLMQHRDVCCPLDEVQSLDLRQIPIPCDPKNIKEPKIILTHLFQNLFLGLRPPFAPGHSLEKNVGFELAKNLANGVGFLVICTIAAINSVGLGRNYKHGQGSGAKESWVTDPGFSIHASSELTLNCNPCKRQCPIALAICAGPSANDHIAVSHLLRY